MILPILYSLTSLGQIQTWHIEIVGSSYRTHEGILNGVITTSSWTVCVGKGLGHVNETTPKQQAMREAQSRHTKKLDSGYHENIETIITAKFFEPMLAKKWQDHSEDVMFPVYSQPKLDGQRCIISVNGMFSRNGKIIVSAPHIYESIRGLFISNPTLVLDGELYSHEYKHDFNRILSLAKKTKPTPDDLADSAKSLEYWIYDCYYNLAGVFIERFNLLKSIITPLANTSINLVETTEIYSLDSLDEIYSHYLDEGFEGQMIRTNALYENKRSKNLLKRKEMCDGEFELVDLQEGRGNHSGLVAKAIFKTNTGIEFETGIIGSHDYCADLLKRRENEIGKMATIIYQNLTPDGIPRFGKMKVIYDL